MIQVYDLLVPSLRRDFSKSLFEAIAYSAVNLGAFSPLIYMMRSGFFAPFWYWVCVTVIFGCGAGRLVGAFPVCPEIAVVQQVFPSPYPLPLGLRLRQKAMVLDNCPFERAQSRRGVRVEFVCVL